MFEGQSASVQRLATEIAQCIDKFVGSARRYGNASPVDGIADQRMPPIREVHANLMGSARLEIDLYIGVRPEALEHPVVRHGRAPGIGNRHAFAVDAVPADRPFDRPAARQQAGANGAVLTRDLPLSECPHEPGMRR